MSKQRTWNSCCYCHVAFETPLLVSACKPCATKHAREWREKHPEANHESVMRWRGKNRAAYNAYQVKWRAAQKAKRLAERLPVHPGCPAPPDAGLYYKCGRCQTVQHPPLKRAYCTPCTNEIERGKRASDKAAGIRPKATHRKCGTCGILFEKASHQSRCGPCGAARTRRRRADDPARAKAATMKSRKKNIERYRTTLKAWRKANPGRYAASKQRSYAKRKGALGSHTFAEWRRVLEASGFKCAYCNCALTEKTATRDHAVPLTRGGSNDISNVVVACQKCNSTKYNRTPEEFAKAVSK